MIKTVNRGRATMVLINGCLTLSSPFGYPLLENLLGSPRLQPEQCWHGVAVTSKRVPPIVRFIANLFTSFYISNYTLPEYISTNDYRVVIFAV